MPYSTRRARPDFVGDSDLRQVRGLCQVESGPVRSGPCSGIWHLPRQPVVEDVTLTARSAEDRVQSGSADVQSPQHLEVAVPPSPNAGPTTQPQPAIDKYDAVNLPQQRLLRSALTDALLRLFGTHC